MIFHIPPIEKRVNLPAFEQVSHEKKPLQGSL